MAVTNTFRGGGRMLVRMGNAATRPLRALKRRLGRRGVIGLALVGAVTVAAGGYREARLQANAAALGLPDQPGPFAAAAKLFTR